VSFDTDTASFDGYFGKQPWAAVPFVDGAVQRALGSRFDVQGVPCVVALSGETGALLSANARGAIVSHKALDAPLFAKLAASAPPAPRPQPPGVQPPPSTSAAAPGAGPDGEPSVYDLLCAVFCGRRRPAKRA
jgi:hypothetical protein